MGKHSIEKPKRKINLKKEFIAILVIIILIFGINYVLSHRTIVEEQNNDEVKAAKTITGEKLVMKSNTEYNKIVEFIFENNILKTKKIYEQFELKEQFDEKMSSYEKMDNIEFIKVDEQEKSIEIENKNLGSDEGKSYEEIYDKYLVQIIGAYQIVE